MSRRSRISRAAVLALACCLTIAWKAAAAPSSSSSTSTSTSTPTPTPTPSAALAARLAFVQAQLSPEAISLPVDDTFGLVGFHAPTLRAAADAVRAALAALYRHDRFVTRPTEPVIAYVFRDRAHAAEDPVPYDVYCLKRLGHLSTTHYAFYESRTREIFATADATFGSLTHEIVHPLLEADFPKAPLWFNEGLASLYEAPVLTPPDDIHGTVNWRLKRLAAALRGKEHAAAALTALFGMSDDQFSDRKSSVALRYATARFTCEWLDAQGKLWPFYRAWRDNPQDTTGEAAFRAAVGRSPAEVEADWEKWVLALK